MLSACTSVGPSTVTRDQFNYSKTLSTAQQEQLLANIVRIRYLESPVFVKVSSLINQYELEGRVALRAGFDDNDVGRNSQNIGAEGRWADKPTITYSPLSGKVFAESLLTPIRPDTLFAMLQAGWPAEILFRICIRSINGIANEAAAPSWRRQADPEFNEVLVLLDRLRTARALSIRSDEFEEGRRIVVYTVPSASGPEIDHDRARLRELLGLDAEAAEFIFSYGLVQQRSDEIAVLTQSILETLNDLAWRVEVPQIHVDEGRTGPTFENDSLEEPIIRILSSEVEPESALVKIRERDYWFYIDDRDVNSKRTFAILRILLSLSESGDTAPAPLVTISNSRPGRGITGVLGSSAHSSSLPCAR
jgi:hypothetical protein